MTVGDRCPERRCTRTRMNTGDDIENAEEYEFHFLIFSSNEGKIAISFFKAGGKNLQVSTPVIQESMQRWILLPREEFDTAAAYCG